MNTFLQFSFNTDKLREHLKHEWMTCFDPDFIDDKIIGGIEKNLPGVQSIINNIEMKATGKITGAVSQTQSINGSQTDDQSQFGNTQSQMNKSVTMVEERPVKELTVPEPFNLTRTKPKMIPLP